MELKNRGVAHVGKTDCYWRCQPYHFPVSLGHNSVHHDRGEIWGIMETFIFAKVISRETSSDRTHGKHQKQISSPTNPRYTPFSPRELPDLVAMAKLWLNAAKS